MSDFIIQIPEASQYMLCLGRKYIVYSKCIFRVSPRNKSFSVTTKVRMFPNLY